MTELVIFDCDGVLVDSEVIASQAEAAALTEAGYPIAWRDFASRFAGRPSADAFAEVAAELGRPLPPDLMAAAKAKIWAAYRADLRPIPGAAETLRRLPLPKCVASSSAPAKLALGLIECRLFDLLYPHIFSTRLVAKGKPAPDIFLYAAAQMGAAPGQCLVVEDSVPGAEAARAAGMACIGFTGGGHAAPDLAARLRAAGAVDVIADLTELLDRV